jgi:hypothetical protein
MLASTGEGEPNQENTKKPSVMTEYLNGTTSVIAFAPGLAGAPGPPSTASFNQETIEHALSPAEMGGERTF